MFDRGTVPATLDSAARLLRSGRLSSVELTTRCLDQVTRYNDDVHAFATITADLAMHAAVAADMAFARGADLGPLHGIPVAIKDVIDVQGVETRAQSVQMLGRIAPAHADAVRRLVEGGAIVVGKATTHEFAFGAPEDGPAGPAARNPWNVEHFAGGSSSGSAVAVATGMALAALGTDTAGSVRSPAALCGVVGLKPGRADISRRGVIPLSASLDSVGVLAMTSTDCGLAMQALTGRHVPLLGSSISLARIGWARHFYEHDAPATPATVAAIERSMQALATHGCEIDEIELSPLKEWNAAGMTVLLWEAYIQHRHWLRTRPQRYGSSLRNALVVASEVSKDDYARAQDARRRLTAEADAALERVDFIVTAIQRGPAPRFDAVDPFGFINQPSYGIVFNVCDLPAISLPIGWSSDGLPLAMQVATRRDRLPQLLQLAAVHEQGMRSRSTPPLPI